MHIGIDARVLERKMTGVGRYLRNILIDIPDYDFINRYILFSKSEIDFENAHYRKLYTGRNHLPEKVSSPLWLNLTLPQLLKKEKIDIFFSPNHLLPFRKLRDIKTIIVIHDVFYKLNKNFHPFSYNKYLDLLLPRSIEISDSIVTVSVNSKKDIMKIFKVPEDKIKVVYEYADQSFKPILITSEVRTKMISSFNLPDQKFILYVGLVENRKNILGLLKIADILKEKKTNICLVIVGGSGFGFDKIYEEIMNRRGYVKYLNYVDDESLKIIYNLAELFVFPSYYEGFGLPPLEAMQSGLPVLASDNSSLPEIVGGGGLLHNADDHEAFALDIERLLKDGELQLQMKHKALKQAENFNKERTVKGLLKVFQNLS